jgi:pyridoxal phosphate enzyme (YggS family)
VIEIMTSIAENIQLIKNQIRECELSYHRELNSVALLAVSKTQPSNAIDAAYQAGQHAFGENYLQEALAKMAELTHLNIEWHFIGPIQSNKTKKIAEHFQWVHSVSEATIAARLNKQRPDHLPPLNICLQVNISHEATKSGMTDADALLLLAEECLTYPRLRLRGLMAIPAEKNIFVDQRSECHKLKLLFEMLCKKGLKLDTLSMGMSSDLIAAIAEGSTMVRIGTKIFGERK